MSVESTNNSSVGQIRKDLSVNRDTADNFELIRLETARFLSVVNVDSECYLRFGSKTAPPIDVREFEGATFSRPTDVASGIGYIYLENPTGATGELLLYTGTDLEADPNPDIGTIDAIDTINDTVATNVTDDTAREVGKVRVQDSAGVLTDPLDAGDMGPFTDRTTTAGNTATVSPGSYGQPVTIVADTSGAATLTVEVSVDGGTTWDAYTVSIGGTEGAKEEVNGFGDVRASIDTNLNGLTVSAKGV